MGFRCFEVLRTNVVDGISVYHKTMFAASDESVKEHIKLMNEANEKNMTDTFFSYREVVRDGTMVGG